MYIYTIHEEYNHDTRRVVPLHFVARLTIGRRTNSRRMNTTPPSSSSSSNPTAAGEKETIVRDDDKVSGGINNNNNVKRDVLLVNFDDEELMHLQDLLKDMKEEYGLNSDVSAVLVNESNWFLTVDGQRNERSDVDDGKTAVPESLRSTERR